MNYKFKITDFEGPLDLLLHLIKGSELSINDVNISDITDQYLSFLKAMEELNLDIASEYLVMATELMLIKSKSLLPISKEEIEASDYIDPELELKEKLLTYEAYKEITKDLAISESERQKYLTKLPELLDPYTDGLVFEAGAGDISDLLGALNAFMQRRVDEVPLSTKITTKEYSVIERRSHIKKILKDKKKVTFDELFDVPTKSYLIVTFLAILEMYKKQEINLKQDKNFDKILITKGVKYE